MSTGLKWLCVAVAIPVVLVVAAIYAAYWYGASALPTPLTPSDREYSVEIRQMYWRSMGGTGDIGIRRLDLLTMAWTVFRLVEDAGNGHIKPSPPDPQALTKVARIRISGVEPGLPTFRRSLAEVALMIRVSREWSGNQVIRTILAEQSLGRGAHGIDQGATNHFGVRANELSPEEMLAFLVLERAPSYYDPSCHRQRFFQRYRFLALRVGMGADETAMARATSRLHAIDCR